MTEALTFLAVVALIVCIGFLVPNFSVLSSANAFCRFSAGYIQWISFDITSGYHDFLVVKRGY